MKQQTIKNIIGIEVKKNFRNNLFPLVTISSVLLILILSSFWVLIRIAQPLKLNLDSIVDNYQYTIESKEYYSDFSCCYKLDSLILMNTSKGKRINSNIYITVDKVPDNLLPKEFNLSSGEISISKKIASQLKVSVGDTITLDLPIYDEPVEYTIANISPYLWDCYDIFSNRDFSVACLPYDNNLISKVNGKYTYFLYDKEKTCFQSNDYSYNSFYNITEDISLLHKYLVIVYFVYISIVSIITIVLSKLNSIIIYSESKKYRNSSYSIAFIKKILRINHLLYVICPLIIISAFSMLLFFIGNIDILIVITFLTLIAVNIIITELKVKSFERVSKI